MIPGRCCVISVTCRQDMYYVQRARITVQNMLRSRRDYLSRVVTALLGFVHKDGRVAAMSGLLCINAGYVIVSKAGSRNWQR